jgi:hypothetical protein
MPNAIAPANRNLVILYLSGSGLPRHLPWHRGRTMGRGGAWNEDRSLITGITRHRIGTEDRSGPRAIASPGCGVPAAFRHVRSSYADNASDRVKVWSAAIA